MGLDRTAHWDNVYETKAPNQVSWTQEYPKTSFEIIQSFELPKTARIIDVGCEIVSLQIVCLMLVTKM